MSSHDLGEIIGRVQSRYIRAAPPREVFEPLLTDLLQWTNSEYGFMADVLLDEQGAPYLRIEVLTDIAWDETTRGLVERHARGGPQDAIEFHNLNTLFGAAIVSREIVISNHPGVDARRGGLPHGHPPLNAFLGVPLFHGGEMVGMLGLANRVGGYDQALVDHLQPLFTSVAAIFGAVRAERARGAAEQALREQREQLQATFDLAGVGILQLSLDGRPRMINQRLCELLGSTREEQMQLRSEDVTHPDDLPTELGLRGKLLSGELTQYRTTKRYLHADGHAVWVNANMTLVRKPDGSPDYFIGVAEDITERMQAEAALRANAAKTEFLSRMSHELRTPLNAVLGFSQLLSLDTAQPLSPSQHARVQHISQAGAHLLAMINDVLDLSRIESGGVALLPTAVPVNVVAGEALAMVAPAAASAGVTVQVDVTVPALALVTTCVRADHLRLRQVLVNLLSNAIKYNRPGGSVTLRWPVDPAGGRVHLQVCDTGIGLTAAQQKHLFEPFNRLGIERSGIEGTGIGLVITQRLVELMNGELSVESAVGEGSCFTAALPLADAARASQDNDSSPVPGTVPAAYTVLYAEENPVNVELVRQVLKMRPSCLLRVAASGEQALRMARQERPDLMLVDMHLGDMSGFDLAQRLSHDPILRGVPRIVLLADASPDQARTALAAGFAACLTKPLNVAQLLRSIDEQRRRVPG
ncbi:MAG: ATP-binding protein [Rhizobacter sp.]